MRCRNQGPTGYPEPDGKVRGGAELAALTSEVPTVPPTVVPPATVPPAAIAAPAEASAPVAPGTLASATGASSNHASCYLMTWMTQRATGQAVMRSSPVTRTLPVTSAKAT